MQLIDLLTDEMPEGFENTDQRCEAVLDAALELMMLANAYGVLRLEQLCEQAPRPLPPSTLLERANHPSALPRTDPSACADSPAQRVQVLVAGVSKQNVHEISRCAQLIGASQLQRASARLIATCV